jgi:uncharacterized membrane protein YeiH
VTPSPPFLFASFVVPPVNSSSVVPGVNATLVLVLSLTGVFVFGLSGGMAGVRAQLDLLRLQGWIDVLDAAGLGLFCVVGADTALAHHLGFADCVILGAVTGIGGGILRDVLVREVPAILRGGFYAIPALCGALIVVTAYRAGDHSLAFPIIGAIVCFVMRIAGMRYGLGLPSAAEVADRGLRR